MNGRDDSLADSLPLTVEREINRLCREFEQAWSGGQSPRIEDFAGRMSGAAYVGALCELIAQEVDLRWSGGHSAEPEEYFQRFPQHTPAVNAAFGLLERRRSSTALSPDTELFTPENVPDIDEEGQPARPTPDDPPVPERLGRFEIERLLGQGAFGAVYLARDGQLSRRVALKVPHRERFSSPEELDHFVEEARTAGQLSHPGIVTIHDVSRDGDQVFIVQEYVEGQDLAKYLKEQTSIPTVEQTARLMIAIAEAVAFAHQKGFVHRDLKPANILLDMQKRPRVADFGLAVHETIQRRRRGERSGTPAYMSPEQVRGETHRLDGRSDLWSLGVILYEMLAGRRPFRGELRRDLFDEITHRDARPPRQIQPQVPAELERICLKCLAKRVTDRYTSALDLASDLQHWLAGGQPPSGAVAETKQIKIVPKGLRSFDEGDADFFIELLPGPRDRDGLPESIRFWKTRLEQTDADRTFTVGLVYGPSGCGKSSLVKAGLLPRLASHVLPIYVEATAADTEVRLLKGLRKACPEIPADVALPEVFESLREGIWLPRGRKIVIVLDQFEQWLHAHRAERDTQLVQALRQCDGGRLQAIVMVRDDFSMAASRFMKDLETRIVEGHNFATVDLFDVDHAENVLTKFGQAFGKLPAQMSDFSENQRAFLASVASGLAQDGKVVSVRLSLFAEMVKGRPWIPATLEQVGGTQGIGVNFLEETFSARDANPEHRLHQQAARAVLKSLLPDVGTDIKGHMRSHAELLETAGYSYLSLDFHDLLRILDSELRLITPTDAEGFQAESGGDPSSKYYQLTHDYLVPSLRDWLTRKQKETRTGRAELRLAERAALWNAKRENRYLPAWWEYLSIVGLTPRKNWTESQKQMMRVAGRHFFYSILASSVMVVMLASAFALQYLYLAQKRALIRGKVDALQSTMGSGVPFAIRDLEQLPRGKVLSELQNRFGDEKVDRKLPLAYGLASFEQVDHKFLVDAISTARAEECDNLVAALSMSSERSRLEIQKAAATATAKQDWILKTRLATVALHLGDPSIAAEMLQAVPPQREPDPQPDWHDAPLDSDWMAIPAGTKASITAAHGILAERFAFCLDMPWETFVTVIETLRPYGYRPTRVRPFVRDGQRQVASVWTRDGRRWHLDRDLIAEKLSAPDATAERDGMLPADVAAYIAPSGNLLYVLLWCECGKEKEQRRLMVGITEDEWTRLAPAMTLAKFAHTLQVVTDADGTRRYSGVWSDQGPAAGSIFSFSGRELTNQLYADLSWADLSLAPIGKPPDPLDSYRRQLAEIATLPLDTQGDVRARLNRATFYYFLGQPEQALADLDDLANQNRFKLDVWKFRALSLAKLGKAHEAKQAFEAKVDRQSAFQTGDDRYVRILLSAWLGEFEEAKRQLDVMADATLNDASTLYKAACVAAQMGLALGQRDPAEAAALKERSVRLLRSATEAGFRNHLPVQSDPDLAPLHGEPGFSALIAELAPAGLYAGLYASAQIESRFLVDLTVEKQLEQAHELARAGFRPLAVTANIVVNDSQLRSAVVWHRPPIAEAKWDPIQRTMFIEHFPKWSGDIAKLTQVVRNVQNASLRSGICLAVGSVEKSKTDATVAWQGVLEDWLVTQPDGGTHSATGWVLRKWGLSPPAIPQTNRSAAGFDWQVTKSGLTMLRIPAGTLLQKDEYSPEPVPRTVTLSEFWLADCEVTLALFQQFIDDNEYKGDKPIHRVRREKTVGPTDRIPVNDVNWYDAVTFCNWLSWKEARDPCYEKTGAKEKVRNDPTEYDAWTLIPNSNGYRLPTEAQWEYACRAGSTTAFSSGDDETLLVRYGVFHSSHSEPVGSKLCNGWGLFDMHGNVSEWCGDPHGTNDSFPWVARGGDWQDIAANCRTLHRDPGDASSRQNVTGFRLTLIPFRPGKEERAEPAQKAAQPEAAVGGAGKGGAPAP